MSRRRLRALFGQDNGDSVSMGSGKLAVMIVRSVALYTLISCSREMVMDKRPEYAHPVDSIDIGHFKAVLERFPELELPFSIDRRDLENDGVLSDSLSFDSVSVRAILQDSS